MRARGRVFARLCRVDARAAARLLADISSLFFFCCGCVCVFLLFVYCRHRAHGERLRMRAKYDRWQAPCEDLERREEQGTDVFQVEKRQQNVFKVLSGAPSAVTLLIHN